RQGLSKTRNAITSSADAGQSTDERAAAPSDRPATEPSTASSPPREATAPHETAPHETHKPHEAHREPARGPLAGLRRGRGAAWEMSFDDLEIALIAADVGARLSAQVVEGARKERERGTPFKEALEKALLDQLEPDSMRQKLRRVGFQLDVSRNVVQPAGTVVMIVGVNGVGKTTTIAKLGRYYTDN